jgi:hypothetical protein
MHKIKSIAVIVVCFIIPLGVFAEEKKENSTPSAPKEDYYVVKKGDTLWDISQKLLKSPWRWKILWDQNKDIPIPNPNLIYPGQKLKLISTASPPPAATPAPAPSAPSAPPEPLPEEVISDTPAQIPEQQPAAPPYYIYSSMNRVGFVRKEQAVSEGSVLRGRDLKNNLSTGDSVYIREPNDKPTIIGKQYTIFRTVPIREERTFIGIQHRMIGLVEITAKESQGIVIGKIIESYRPILSGDLLMSYTPRSQRVILSASPNGIRGKILMSEENIKAFGEHHTIFIDKGEKDGIAVGQRYTVCEPLKMGEGESRENVGAYEIGSVLVLHTEQDISTVLITKSVKEFHPGMEIRTPDR